MAKQIETYEEAVAYLLQIPRFTTKHTPDETRQYLQVLGNPDQKLRIIHVAGTNGKGSVCAYIRHILEAAGYTTCVFTSPHLVDMRERFLVKGELVSKASFLKAFRRVYEGLDEEALAQGTGYHPTFFEFLFFMAMLLFAEAQPDYCILETGLGGRLDATNAVSQKILTVITRLGLDHVEYLGDTLEKIAYEKAGIITKGVPLVCLDTAKSSSQVLLETAKAQGAPLFLLAQTDFSFLKFNKKSIDFSLHSEYYGNVTLQLSTQARYQIENAALAVWAISALDQQHTISLEQIREGLRKCRWQGRMEEIFPNVYVDGAHNEDGIRAFLETVCQDGCVGRRSLLFSVVQDKDYTQMIARIMRSHAFARIAIAPMHTGRTTDMDTLEEIFAREEETQGRRIHSVYDNVSEALEALWNTRQEEEFLYIAGSLYLVGEIKTLLEERKAWLR